MGRKYRVCGAELLFLALFLTGQAMANVSPVAVNDTVRVEENGRINIDVLANDFDADGDSIRSRGTLTDAKHARLLVRNTDGTIHYRPRLSFVGQDSFVYVMEDGRGGLAGATVYIAVFEAYHAIDDTMFVLINGAKSFPILSNDWVDPQDSIWVSSITPGVHTDRLVINTDQTVFYRPVADFVGRDTLTYTAETVKGRTYGARVFVDVLMPNAALNDTFQIRESSRINLWPLTNDRAAPGDTLRLLSFGEASHSERLVQNGDGTIHYRPLPGYIGEDAFPYTVLDPSGAELSAWVVIEILPLNAARDDTLIVRESGRINVDVLANDLFYGDTAPDYLSFSEGGHSERVVENSDGTLHYRPQPGYVGADQFTYEILNGRGDERATGTVVIQVLPIDALFLVGPDTVALSPGQARIVDVLANDRHVEGRPLTVSDIQASGEVHAVDERRIFLRAPAVVESLSVAYRIQDDQGGAVSATLEIEPQSGAPSVTARDDSLGVDPREEASLSVLANDAGLVRILEATAPVQGQVAVSADGQSLRYRPKAGAEGVDVFYYIAESDGGTQMAARVVLSLSAFNRAPLALDDTVRAAPGQGVLIDLAANDRDDDGDSLWVTAAGTSEHTSPGVLLSDGRVFFRVADSFLGTAQFDYDVVDEFGLSSSGRVVIQSGNGVQPLVAKDDTLFAWVGARLNIDVLQNDLGSAIAVVETVPGAFTERVVINSDGTVHYRPDSSFVEGDAFVYVVRDALARTAAAQVHVIAQTQRTGDFDGDGQVDFADFLRFVQSFGLSEGASGFDPLADIDQSGKVDFHDFLAFVGAFGK